MIRDFDLFTVDFQLSHIRLPASRIVRIAPQLSLRQAEPFNLD
ncbi:unnamed protein product [Ciceribacter sp. T2.26MG-112.2]|nr:unnamed protein product [Ciceribacter naphthalenivorans]